MPGKELLVADALSRAYFPEAEIKLDLDIKSLDLLSVSRDKFVEIANHTNQELSVLYNVIVKGWPDTRSEVPVEIRQFWDSRDQLSVIDGVIFKGLTQVFATHTIPQILRFDNGPQFDSKEFREYCNGLDIEHVTSSPNFQSSNGLSERAVQTVKRLWKKAADPYLALLDYRTTPIEGLGLLSSQLLMGRRPRNTLPTACEILKPTAYNTAEVKHFYNSEKEKQKHYYDSRRGAKELPPLNNDSEVRVAVQPGKAWSPALVESKAGPRSYNVVSGNREYRRNRKHIRQSTRLANTQTGSGSSSGSHMPELAPFEVRELLETLKSPVVKSQSSTPEINQSFTQHKVRESSEITTRSDRTVKVPQKLNL